MICFKNRFFKFSQHILDIKTHCYALINYFNNFYEHKKIIKTNSLKASENKHVIFFNSNCSKERCRNTLVRLQKEQNRTSTVCARNRGLHKHKYWTSNFCCFCSFDNAIENSKIKAQGALASDRNTHAGSRSYACAGKIDFL